MISYYLEGLDGVTASTNSHLYIIFLSTDDTASSEIMGSTATNVIAVSSKDSPQKAKELRKRGH